MLAMKAAGARVVMSNRLKLVLTLTAFVALLVAWILEGQGGLPESSELGDRKQSEGEPANGLPAGGLVFFASPDFSRRATPLVQPFRLQLRSSGTNPNTGLGERYSRFYSLSFQPKEVCGITANDFIVFGLGRHGVPIFERWVLHPDEGTYFTVRTLPTTGVGISVPMGTTTVHILGDYTSPSKMDNIEPILAREQVYRGGPIGTVINFVVDPEGRFILVLSDDSDGLRRIWQIHLNEEIDPTVFITEIEFPILLESNELEPRLSASQGFHWLVTGDSTFGIIWDPNYDGVIDSASTIESGEYFDLYHRGDDNIPLTTLFD